MKTDYLTFKRAINVSLGGLVLQLLMGLLLLIYGFRTGDETAKSGAVLVLGGVGIWVVLAILFDLYRRERIEAMEAESYASSEGSSVFDEGAGDLRLAAKRLGVFTKFVVPILSLIYAIVIGLLGYLRFVGPGGLSYVDPDNFADSDHPLVAMVIGLVLAFVGFVFGRFVSGMSGQKAWRPLSAGAGAAVGLALIGASIAVGHFVDYMGSDAVLRWLHAIVPAAIMLLAVETIVHFVWDLYRPRKAGEMARAAFDSRLLGAIAAPDRVAQSIAEALNYQFGSERASTWFSELMRNWGWRLGLGGLVIMWLLSCLVVVQPNQRALILRFGAVANADAGPGIHLKAPWPIDRAVFHDVQGVKRMEAGAPPPPEDTRAILWAGDHHRGVRIADYHLLTRPSPNFIEEVTRESADVAILVAEAPIVYSVGDVQSYESFVQPDQIETLLEETARREVMMQFASMTVDGALDTRRGEMERILTRRMARAMSFRYLTEVEAMEGVAPEVDGTGSPIDIAFASVVGIHPPDVNVAKAFENLIQAEQKRDERIERARATAESELIKVAGSVDKARLLLDALDRLDAMDKSNSEGELAMRVEIDRLLDDAGGEVASAIHKAGADRWALHMDARGRARDPRRDRSPAG